MAIIYDKSCIDVSPCAKITAMQRSLLRPSPICHILHLQAFSLVCHISALKASSPVVPHHSFSQASSLVCHISALQAFSSIVTEGPFTISNNTFVPFAHKNFSLEWVQHPVQTRCFTSGFLSLFGDAKWFSF